MCNNNNWPFFCGAAGNIIYLCGGLPRKTLLKSQGSRWKYESNNNFFLNNFFKYKMGKKRKRSEKMNYYYMYYNGKKKRRGVLHGIWSFLLLLELYYNYCISSSFFFSIHFKFIHHLLLHCTQWRRWIVMKVTIFFFISFSSTI